jgi:flagellar biogenesis protein FliO
MTRDFRAPELPQTPVGFKIWFAFCALLALGLIGLVVWAVVTLVNKA